MENRIRDFLLIGLGFILLLSNSCKKNDDSLSNTVKDIDGNVYHTVTIGTQVWLVENLKTTRFNDGTDIPLVTRPTKWDTINTPGYCWYFNGR